LDGNEDKSRDRYIYDLIFHLAEYENTFWDGYENGKDARGEDEE